MSLRTLALCVLLALVAVAAYWGARASQPSERQEQIVALCDDVGAERYEAAIARSEALVGPDPDGRIAAECRCWALLNRGERDACADLVDGILMNERARDWVPHPVLASLVVRSRMAEGRGREAARLASAAAAMHPEDFKLLELEVGARSQVEGQDSVLRDMESRLSPEASSLPLRITLAISHSGRFDGESALRVLGERAPDRTHPLWLAWFEERARAIALLGDVAALRGHFAMWGRVEGDSPDLRARYALRISISQLLDPDHGEIELLERALAEQRELQDPRLRWALYRRLIGVLVDSQRIDEALQLYDAASQVVDFPNLTRAEIERAALSLELAEVGGEQASGVLAFALAEGFEEAGELLLSADVGASADSEYEAIPLAPSGVVVRERRRAVTPQRWVFRDAEGRPRASGTVWPLPGERVEVEIQPRQALDSRAPLLASSRIATPRREADGRQRLFAIILDCSDWRLVQYLRARGELPLLDHLMQIGYSAVLESNPAFTAAAMESLVWPLKEEDVSFLGLVQRMGLELGGLASVGSNPVDFLSAVLPESENLFHTLGGGNLVAANMLFSHGGIDAGSHAEMSGPDGQRRKLKLRATYRALTPAERRAYPGLVADPAEARRVETIAAEFDSAVDIVRQGEVDMLLLRIESLDLLTHTYFRGLLEAGQDDGRSPLLESYRYIDTRLREVYSEMDSDDRLVVMSDHGIRTPMEHETDAIFVLVGGDVPKGRAPGMPHLRGVPRLLANLVGIETAWPDTGLAPWAIAKSPGAAGEGDGEMSQARDSREALARAD